MFTRFSYTDNQTVRRSHLVATSPRRDIYSKAFPCLVPFQCRRPWWPIRGKWRCSINNRKPNLTLRSSKYSRKSRCISRSTHQIVEMSRLSRANLKARESIFTSGPDLYRGDIQARCPPDLEECVMAMEDCCEEVCSFLGICGFAFELCN